MNQFEHRIAQKEVVLAAIETKAHFVKIGGDMLRRVSMPSAHDAARVARRPIMITAIFMRLMKRWVARAISRSGRLTNCAVRPAFRLQNK